MQLLFRRLVLFLTLAATAGILPHKAFATHLAGSDISYTCLGGSSYRIDLTFYRDCQGTSAPPSVIVDFHSISCNIHFTDALLPVPNTGHEITYPCPGLTTSCDDPTSTVPGIQQWHYSGVVNFPMQCADWVISWQYCCRNCDITTLNVPQPCVSGSNPPMYISTTLNNLSFNCNSSPYFTNNPIVFVCVGQNFTYNHGAIDPDGDSLVYSLVDPLDSASVPVTYLPPYSATNPVISSPALSLNSQNGDIIINPTNVEVGVLSVRVEEYRNGVLVGYVVRDMEIYVRPCNNIIPTATGMNGTTNRDTTVCPGTQICFDVFSNDLDVGQIVTMTWNQGIVGATYTVSGFPYPTGHFCWTPGVNDISNNPHQFTVSVVDNACPNSGYQTYSFNILVNSPLVNINVTDISCNGSNDGAITVVPVNAGGYSYLWTAGGQTTSGISGLSPGSYPVTVYDSTTGCSATFPNTITNPSVLSDSTFTITSSCTGSSSGIIATIASGGTPGYTYLWTTIPPSINDTVFNVAPGTYNVTITDSHGCTTTGSVTVNSSSSAINITVDSTSTLNCYTDTTGIASISVTGGTPGYTYLWNTNPPQSGTTATGLSPGTYLITVTDSLGCSSTDSATVSSPPPIVLVGSARNASCGASDGAAYISASGGVPGYTYAWLGYPNTTDSLPNVPVGLYSVTVTDTNGCTQQEYVLVGSLVISSTANGISPAGCNGGSNGMAVATASGGTPPYVFVWNTIPPQVNDTATGLSPGLYIVTITDSVNCSTVDTVHLQNPPVMNINVVVGNTSCSGDSTGIATAHVSGGLSPYTYSWSPYGGTDSTAVQLIPGNYQVTVTDSAGCVQVANVTIQTNTTIVISTDSIIQPSCNGGNDGAIYISVTGGTTPYSYLWNPGSINTQDLTNVDAGSYILIVTDSNGCTQADTITLSQPPPVPANAGSDTVICSGATIQLNATLTPGTTGTWFSSPPLNFNDIHDPNAIVSNVPGATVILTWSVVDSNGCTGSDNLTLFNFNLNAGADILQCGLSPIQLNGAILSGFTGLWTGGNSNISIVNDTLFNTFVNFSDYGVDTLTWTVIGTACSSTDEVVVAAYQMPIAAAGDSQIVCSSIATLMAFDPNPGDGMWTIRQPSNSILADSLDPHTGVSNLPKGGTTVFVWTVTNGVCVAADTVQVYFDEACEIELPTGFSPNGDTYNDGYFIKGIDGYPDNIFHVFNRWGNEVYVKDNYVNSDWKGQNTNGEELPESTYYVILEVKNSNIKKNTFVDLRRFTGIK